MKNTVHLFGIIAMLLTAACDKDDTEPAGPSVPVYEFISVEYGALEIEPVSEVVYDKVIRNERDVAVRAEHGYESHSGYSSEFIPDGPLAGIFEKCDVPIPEIDKVGNPVEPYFWKAPFSPNEVYTCTRSTSQMGASVDLPPHSQFSMRVTNLGYKVRAGFVCRMLASDAGVVEIKGTWGGEWVVMSESYSAVSDLE